VEQRTGAHRHVLRNPLLLLHLLLRELVLVQSLPCSWK
jgi:hypothetical protein